MNTTWFHWECVSPLAEGGVTGGQLALIAVIMVVIALTLISNARRRRQKGPSPRAYAREQISRIREERAVKSEMGDLMQQLERLARDVNSQLDTKFMKLERCIADADERIARLERPPRRAATRPVWDTTIGDESSTGQSADSSRRKRIYAMHDAGKSPLEIAQTLDIAIGEVELVVGLRHAKPGKKLSAQA